jgi:hypothetical protein
MGVTRLVVVGALLVAACGGSEGAAPADPAAAPTSSTAGSATTSSEPAGSGGTPSTTTGKSGDECAHVRAVDITAEAEGVFTFAVTVESTDTGWEKYADAWEVRGPDGAVLGERVLAHPHENEQPFTRSLSGVEIPTAVAEVTVAAHDLVLGFCGDELTVPVPHDG